MTRNRPEPLAEDTVGPYYPLAFCNDDRADMLEPQPGEVFRASGTPIVLTGRILDADGAAVHPALVEYWHADAQGFRPSRDPHFAGAAREYLHGPHYRLTTIKPGAEPGRAPQVTLTIFCDGIARVVTQIFFDDAPGNADDPLLAALPADRADRLIARHSGVARGAVIYERDIVLRGAGETPFFDDLGN
jgi:protocatechuate 3,4-dioxygenase, alpha subunit